MEGTDLKYLQPAVFEDATGVAAGFSTRHGGVSPPPYHTMNLGLSTGDTDAHVLENRRLLFESVGFSMNQLAIAGQVHGAEVKEVTEPGLFKGYDAMVTRQPGVMLCISAADCAAVLLADPGAGVIGGCHSGWRGTVANVSRETIRAMQALGAVPGRVRAYVSPCISVEHFEVGEEVACQFEDRFVLYPDGREKPHVDLKGVIADQLEQEGVPPSQIELDPRCTVADGDDFYSYRAEDGKTGRMMGFIGMKPAAASPPSHE